MIKRVFLASALGSFMLMAAGTTSASAQQGHWFYDDYRHYNADDSYRRERRMKRKFRRKMRERAQRRAWLKHFRQRHYGGARPVYPGNGHYIEEDEVIVFRPNSPWRSRQIIEGNDLPPVHDRRARYQPDLYEFEDEDDFARQPRVRRNAPRRQAGNGGIRPEIVPIPKAKPKSIARYRPNEIEVSALETNTTDPVVKPKVRALEETSPREVEETPKLVKRRKGESVSCAKARGIVAGFGFTNIEAKSCTGKVYDFSAKRDGKPFQISLLAASGELKQVKRLK